MYHFVADNNAEALVLSLRAQVPGHICQYLKGFQLQALRFLNRHYEQRVSCIFNDESGLGKTVTTAVFLDAVVCGGDNRTCLIVVQNDEDIVAGWEFHLSVLTNLSVAVVTEDMDSTSANNVYIGKWCTLKSIGDLSKLKFDYIVVDNRGQMLNNNFCLSMLLKNYEKKVNVLISSLDITSDLKLLHNILRLCGRLDHQYKNWKIFDEKFKLPNLKQVSTKNVDLEEYFLKREILIDFCKSFRLRRYRHQLDDSLPLVDSVRYHNNMDAWRTARNPPPTQQNTVLIQEVLDSWHAAQQPANKTPAHGSESLQEILSISTDKDTEELFEEFMQKKKQCASDDEVEIILNERTGRSSNAESNEISDDTVIMSPLLFLSESDGDSDEPECAEQIIEIITIEEDNDEVADAVNVEAVNATAANAATNKQLVSESCKRPTRKSQKPQKRPVSKSLRSNTLVVGGGKSLRTRTVNVQNVPDDAVKSKTKQHKKDKNENEKTKSAKSTNSNNDTTPKNKKRAASVLDKAKSVETPKNKTICTAKSSSAEQTAVKNMDKTNAVTASNETPKRKSKLRESTKPNLEEDGCADSLRVVKQEPKSPVKAPNGTSDISPKRSLTAVKAGKTAESSVTKKVSVAKSPAKTKQTTSDTASAPTTPLRVSKRTDSILNGAKSPAKTRENSCDAKTPLKAAKSNGDTLISAKKALKAIKSNSVTPKDVKSPGKSNSSMKATKSKSDTLSDPKTTLKTKKSTSDTPNDSKASLKASNSTDDKTTKSKSPRPESKMDNNEKVQNAKEPAPIKTKTPQIVKFGRREQAIAPKGVHTRETRGMQRTTRSAGNSYKSKYMRKDLALDIDKKVKYNKNGAKNKLNRSLTVEDDVATVEVAVQPSPETFKTTNTLTQVHNMPAPASQMSFLPMSEYEEIQCGQKLTPGSHMSSEQQMPYTFLVPPTPPSLRHAEFPPFSLTAAFGANSELAILPSPTPPPREVIVVNSSQDEEGSLSSQSTQSRRTRVLKRRQKQPKGNEEQVASSNKATFSELLAQQTLRTATKSPDLFSNCSDIGLTCSQGNNNNYNKSTFEGFKIFGSEVKQFQQQYAHSGATASIASSTRDRSCLHILEKMFETEPKKSRSKQTQPSTKQNKNISIVPQLTQITKSPQSPQKEKRKGLYSKAAPVAEDVFEITNNGTFGSLIRVNSNGDVSPVQQQQLKTQMTQQHNKITKYLIGGSSTTQTSSPATSAVEDEQPQQQLRTPRKKTQLAGTANESAAAGAAATKNSPKPSKSKTCTTQATKLTKWFSKKQQTAVVCNDTAQTQPPQTPNSTRKSPVKRRRLDISFNN